MLKLIFHSCTFKVAVNTVLADVPRTFAQNVVLAHAHIANAFDMPRLAPRTLSSDPNVHCVIITQAMRSYRIRKQAERFEVAKESAEMAHLRCPISFELMDMPVVAQGGHTYDFASFQRLRSTLNQRGVDGLDLQGTSCNLNRALWLLVNAFKEEYGIATTPVPPELLEGPWPLPVDGARRPPAIVASTFAGWARLRPSDGFVLNLQPHQVHDPPVAVAPKALAKPRARPSPARFQPQMTLRQIFLRLPALSVSELFKFDGFLDCITMAGLNMFLRLLTDSGRDFTRNTSKGTMIRWVVDHPTVLSTDLLVPFLDNAVFLDHIDKPGLSLLLGCIDQFRGSADESKPSRIYRILQKLPLKLKIKDDTGNFELTMTRSNTTQYLYAQIAFKRSLLHIGSTAVPLAAGFDNVGNHGVRYGSEIDIRIRNQFASPDDLGPDDFQIFVRVPDGSLHVLVVQSQFTILQVKTMMQDLTNHLVDEQRLIFLGKQLEDDSRTLSDYDIIVHSTLHMQLRLRGGAKKGVKKLLKDVKLAGMRAASQYKATLVDPAVVARVITPIATTAQCIQQQIGALDLPQLRQLEASFDDIEVVRESSVVDALIPTLFPPAADIDARIASMQQQIVELASQKEAIVAAVTTCFADEFYKENGSQYDYKALFNSVPARIEVLEQQQIRDQQAQIALQQAQLAQQQAALLAHQPPAAAGHYNVFAGHYVDAPAPDAADMDL